MAAPAAALLKRPDWAGLRGASAGPFPLITLVLVIVVGLSCFIAATYLEVFDDGSGEPWTTGASTFSRSAIGHRALAASLRKLGIPVEISRFRTLDKVGADNLLVMIEPNQDRSADPILSRLTEVSHALLVLPKWRGRTDIRKPIWIDRMELLPIETPRDILRNVVSGGSIVRSGGTVTKRSDRFGGKLQIADPQYFSNSDAADVAPLIETPNGTLLGRLQGGGTELWILSDPDLLSNFGIGQGDNGVIAISVIEALLPKGGTVIIDETAHGFEQRPNLLRTLLHPPFVAILIAGIAALLTLVWGGATRFGGPQAEAAGLAAGKLTLVRNAAQLLRLGTGAGNLLQSYRRLTLADAIAELHGPSGLDEFAQAAWLDRAAQHRGLDARLRPLLDEISALAEAGRIDSNRALRCALDLHRWKQEILHGTVPARRRGAAASGQPSSGQQSGG